MAGRKENLKALFSNTRSRVIILFTAGMLLLAVLIGVIKIRSAQTESPGSSASLTAPTGIQSIPGSINPTEQYASLQEAQNREQAVRAAKKGSSAIPTIIRTHAFGDGVERVGSQHGEGGVGFETLAREESGGPQRSLWLQTLKDNHCSKDSVLNVVNQGASLNEIRGACSCVQLKDSGYVFSDLKPFCSCKELKAAGFNAKQMKEAGFSAGRLRECGFDACTLRGTGFSAQQMKDGGFADGELKGAGFSENEIAHANGLPDGISEEDVRRAGCQVDALRKLHTAGVSAAAIARINGCSAAQLKAAGYNAEDLKQAGFSAADLRQAGFNPDQLKQAGYSARDLLNAGISPANVLAAGFSPQELAAAEKELPPGVTPANIKEAGCHIEALKRERLAGVSATLIHHYAGCSAQALKAAGFTDGDLVNAGFTPTAIHAAMPVDNATIQAAACDPIKLRGLLKQGVSAKHIRELNGCSADALKAAGFDAAALTDAGFTPQQLIAAGFTPEQIKAALAQDEAMIQAAGCDPVALKHLQEMGVSASKIRERNGCTIEAFKKAGFGVSNLSEAGFTPKQLLAAGFSPDAVKRIQPLDDAIIQAAGCDPTALGALQKQGVTAKRIHDLNGCSAQALKAAGFDAKALSDAGFSPQQLIAAGFSPDAARLGKEASDNAIRAAGCDPAQLSKLHAAGVSAERIRELNGCSAEALRKAGYSANELAAAGFSPDQLLAAGFSPDEIKAAEALDDNAIRRAGCDPTALRVLQKQGVTAKRIHDLNGCSAQALKAAGFDAKALSDAGFSPQQLIAAGFSPDAARLGKEASDNAIRAAGCDPAQLSKLHAAGVSAERIRELNGCSAEALRKAGYSANELAAAGFSPDQLSAAGFSPDEIKAAEALDENAIRRAGCDPTALRALQKQGVTAKRIHDLNGCSAQALKAAGFDAKALSDAGFSPQQLIAAGFSPDAARLGKEASDNAIRAAGCDPAQLSKLHAVGVSAERIRELNGCSAEALRKAGYSANELAAAGFSPDQLLAAGFSPGDIRATYPLEDSEIKAAGCDGAKLKALFAQGVSAQRIRRLNGCDAAALKQAGYDANELLDAGFTPQSLMAVGFTPEQIKAAEMAVGDQAVRAAGCNPLELKKLAEKGVSAKRIHDLNGCSAEALKEAGFDAKALEDAGYTPQQLLAAGFTSSSLKAAQPLDDNTIRQAGCDPTKLKALFLQHVSAERIHNLNHCSAEALKQAGYGAGDLLNAGFTPEQLLKAGFSPAELGAAGIASATEANGSQAIGDTAIKAAGCDPLQLKKLFDEGISAKRIHVLNGCDAAALKEAGFNAKELANAGFTPASLLKAGFSPEVLTEAGLNPIGVISSGRTANCSVESLKAAHALNVSATTLKQTLGCSANALKAAGYTAEALRAAGFSAAELKNAGFNASELKNAGFGLKDLTAAGFSAEALKDLGFTASQLKEAGFNAAQLKNAGFSPEQLKAAGYDLRALKEAGFDAAALRKAGYTLEALKNAGFGADQLKKTGYTTAELQQAGFSPQDSSVAGLENGAPMIIPSVTAPIPTLSGPLGVATNEAENTKQLQEILKRQKKQMVEQRYQQEIQQRTAAMVGIATQTIQDWKTPPTQVYIPGSPPKNAAEMVAMQGNSGVAADKGGAASNTLGTTAVGPPAVIKAGDILFAVIDTSVNTDEPSPILATIVAGRLKGAKLIGSFTLPSNANKMVINFNMMSVPGAAKTISISAYAIDANTARTALSSRTDHHYLLRYGSLFAATFLEGFGNAFQSANTTITIGGVGDTSNTTIQNGAGRSILENAVIGLATLGKNWGQVAQQQFSTPTTVEVYSGTGIGVLFTQDVASL